MVKKNNKLKDTSNTLDYPPVVAVLGHVDHGKTSLLDAIRKTNIAVGEHGGITQGIGASSIEITVEGVKKRITFIDTPGHEAFTHMRGRGTQAADIGLLVVSSVDGVMPQTKESIEILKKAQIPFIVVLTKADIQDKNEEKAKRQLVKEGVLLEGYGGDVPYISVSSKTIVNIKELLELISLVFDMKQKPILDNKLKGIVIESQLDQKSGPRATVVIKSGVLKVRDEIECDGIRARVRTIINDKDVHLDKATIGEAVEVLGFEKVPPVGGLVGRKGETFGTGPVSLSPRPMSSEDALPAGTRQGSPTLTTRPEVGAIPQLAPLPFRSGQEAMPMPEDFLNAKEIPTLSIVLCADNQGSLEAIIRSLPKEINIALAKTGDITTTDILLAKSINAIVLGFNVKIRPEIMKFAIQEKVLVKNYKIIYELIDEIKDVLEGKQLALVEEIYGRAKILASFPFEKTKVLGIKVLEGRVARGDKVRLIRKEEIIGESTINSVRMNKNVVSKIEENHEGGIIILPFLDFTIGDVLVCHG